MSVPSQAVPEAGTATSMQPAIVVTMLALLLGIQPVTTDLYLPALPSIRTELGASMAQTQLTLSALLLAFGCAQLVLGPLSDRFGRRPVLLVGLAAYVLAAIASAAAPTMQLLIVARTLQGAAMGAAVMCARAIVRDLYAPAAGARVMSRALSGLGVIACLCAPLGSLLATYLGWRHALLVLAVFGAGTLALVALRFHETVPAKNPRALQLGTLLPTWRGILHNRSFQAFTLLTCGSYGLLFTFLASSSFMFIQVLGLSKTTYGLVMLWTSAWYVAGTFLCRRWLARHGVVGSVARGGFLSLGGTSLMALLVLSGIHSPWALLLPMALCMLGHGVHQPCGQTGAIGPFAQAAGAASALNGFMQMVVAFGVGAWLGVALEERSTKPLALGIAFWGAVLALLAWQRLRRGLRLFRASIQELRADRERLRP